MKYTVSVIIPAYNAEKTIERCLKSIPMHESITEVIIYDDGSIDKTAKILKRLCGENELFPVITITGDENKGVGYAFNRLLDEASGDYILRMDSDDYFTEEMPKVLDLLDGSDIIYFNMTDNEGYTHHLSPKIKTKTVACCHLYRREFIGDTRTDLTNWGEDAALLHRLLDKNPTELFTDIDAYHYDYPREGSLTDLRKKRKAGLFEVEEPELNLFTNCHKGCTTEPTIFETYQSYVETFGEPKKVTVYCDPNPNPELYDEYSLQIHQYFGKPPVKTKGLADGYLQSVDNAKTSHIVQLEADWKFQNIKHGIKDILKEMIRDERWFMLFNQHQNMPMQWLRRYQTYFKPSRNAMYCLSDRVSNNPHIIEIATYKKNIVPLVDWAQPGAGQIEQVLEKKHQIAVYGKYGLKPTIVHLDMRRGGAK